MVKKPKVFNFSMIVAICCLISGVLLCGELVAYAIESNVPVNVIQITEQENEVEVEDEVHALVRNRLKLIQIFNLVTLIKFG